MMKDSYHPRKTKNELVAKKAIEEEEKQNLMEFSAFKGFLAEKRMKLDDIPNILHQNDQLVAYLKDKNMMSQDGKINQ